MTKCRLTYIFRAALCVVHVIFGITSVSAQDVHYRTSILPNADDSTGRAIESILTAIAIACPATSPAGAAWLTSHYQYDSVIFVPRGFEPMPPAPASSILELDMAELEEWSEDFVTYYQSNWFYSRDVCDMRLLRRYAKSLDIGFDAVMYIERVLYNILH